MRGIVRAGLYLPRGTDGQRRYASRDEDGLTFLAAAIERTTAGADAPSGDLAVFTVGVEARLTSRDWTALAGRAPASVAACESLPRALGAALESRGPAWVAVVSERGAGAAPTPLPGEGAALLVVDDGAKEPRPFLRATETTGSGSAALAVLWADAARGDPRCVGDWAADLAVGPRATQPGPSPTLADVSQGAYVPDPQDEADRGSRWGLLGERCVNCSRLTFPARGRCAGCGHRDGLLLERLPTDGARVVAATWIGPGGQPTEFDPQVEAQGGYGVVLAELAPGVRVTLQLTDAMPGEIAVGSRVDARLRRLYALEGRWRYGRKAMPAGPAGQPVG